MPLINSGVLCLSYLLSRILFQTYISVGYAYPGFYNQFLNLNDEVLKGRNRYVYIAFGCFMMTVNLLSQIINYYWFSLIVQQVRRNIKKAMGGKVEEYVDVQRENN